MEIMKDSLINTRSWERERYRILKGENKAEAIVVDTRMNIL